MIMRSCQASIRIELFDKDKPMQFSVYSDANDMYESLSKLMHAAYSRISQERNCGSYEEFIDELKNIESASGVCEIYENQFEADQHITNKQP